MPKSEKGDSKKSSKLDGYFHWSREPSVGLFAVLLIPSIVGVAHLFGGEVGRVDVFVLAGQIVVFVL